VSKRKNKYKPGPVINNVETVIKMINLSSWIYLFGRPKHPTIIDSMTLRTVRGFIKHKQLRIALLNKED